ncbi:DUF6776 family protein [Marinicella meishanensis]|uniref:DUF6776 family protein n=1 Tax=Marinicella meishanensis TaxID=2873263 RepID=UPI001CBBC474|nr:DUF6776 family protein [Marinicella sp. NBU2979]
MSNNSPKYVIQRLQDEPSFIRRHWLIASLLGLAVVAFLMGRYGNWDVLQAFKGQKQTWTEVNQQLSEENERHLRAISLLNTEAKIKQQAILELQQNLQDQAQENARLKAELAFYENLLSHKDGIRKLRVFEIAASQQGDLIDLKLVLAQKLEKAQMVSGTLDMQLTGIQDEVGQSIDLVEQFQLDEAFEFKYFQIKKYTISLPKGFNPTTLLVELKPKQKKQDVVSELFQWSEIFQDQVTVNGANSVSTGP